VLSLVLLKVVEHPFRSYNPAFGSARSPEVIVGDDSYVFEKVGPNRCQALQVLVEGDSPDRSEVAGVSSDVIGKHLRQPVGIVRIENVGVQPIRLDGSKVIEKGADRVVTTCGYPVDQINGDPVEGPQGASTGVFHHPKSSPQRRREAGDRMHLKIGLGHLRKTSTTTAADHSAR
jgi:hypothetical protein